MLRTAENMGMTKIGKYKSVVGREIKEVDLYLDIANRKYYLDINGDYLEIDGRHLAKIMHDSKIDFHTYSVEDGIVSEYKYILDDIEMTLVMRTKDLREVAVLNRVYTEPIKEAILRNDKVTLS